MQYKRTSVNREVIKTTVIAIRFTPKQRSLLEAAALKAHRNLSDWIRLVAIEAAQNGGKQSRA